MQHPKEITRFHFVRKSIFFGTRYVILVQSLDKNSKKQNVNILNVLVHNALLESVPEKCQVKISFFIKNHHVLFFFTRNNI